MTLYQLPYRFDEDDIIWKLIEEYGLSSEELRILILAHLYSIANEHQEGNRFVGPYNEAMREFAKRGENQVREDIVKNFFLSVFPRSHR